MLLQTPVVYPGSIPLHRYSTTRYRSGARPGYHTTAGKERMRLQIPVCCSGVHPAYIPTGVDTSPCMLYAWLYTPWGSSNRGWYGVAAWTGRSNRGWGDALGLCRGLCPVGCWCWCCGPCCTGLACVCWCIAAPGLCTCMYVCLGWCAPLLDTPRITLRC